MTLIRDLFCADGRKKKIIIYVVAVSGIVILLITALVVDKWPLPCKMIGRQSPVALNQRFANKQKLTPIKLENFEKCDCVNIKNNGHTVTVVPSNICNCQKPKLSGALLTQNYTMESFHFHWPSEHTIDGLQYALEAHFVFFANKYGNFEEALKHPYGITVMAILFLDTNYTASNNFRILADGAKVVSPKSGSSTISTKQLNFYEFLPYDHEAFYTYEGSLTTPNCAEFVNWIVYKNHSNIAYADLKDLSTIYNHHQKLLVTNNRVLQELGNRTVYLQDVSN